MINSYYGSMRDRWPVYAMRITLWFCILAIAGVFFLNVGEFSAQHWAGFAAAVLLLAWFFGGMSASRAYMAGFSGRYPLGDRRNKRLNT